jgi:hypothetical protein
MSADNIFRPLFTEGSSLNSQPAQAPTTLNSTATALPTPLDSTVPLFSNPPATQKDLSTIAPAFFVGVPEKENKVTFQVDAKESNDAPIGYGDRRLSGILSEVKSRQNALLYQFDLTRYLLGLVL